MRRCGVRRAFSLIEVLVALAIVAALTAVIVPAVGGWKARGALDAAERQLGERVSAARMRAARSGEAVEITDGPSDERSGESAPAEGDTEEPARVIAGIALPDGRIVKVQPVVLRAGGGERRVRVNPWTGLVERLADEAPAREPATGSGP